jgi:hypothetical protein
MVFPTDNSDVHERIPSLAVQQADKVRPVPPLACGGGFVVYYAAVFERGPEPVRIRTIR